jgi:hypothetical protein
MGQTNWTSLGRPGDAGTISPPYVIQNVDGRLEAFLAIFTLDDPTGTNGSSTLWHILQQSPGKAWSTWVSLDMPFNKFSLPVAARNADGHLEFFIWGPDTVGSDYVLWHSLQTTPGSGWGTWASLGSPTSSVGEVYNFILQVESNLDGRLEVFATGSDSALWHMWQLTPNGLWSSWSSLGKPPTSNYNVPVAARNADGRIEVFMTGNDGNFWHIWQTAPGGRWSNWFTLDQPAFAPLEPLVIQNADGRLELFAIGGPEEQGLSHIWQTAPGGRWSNWNSLGKLPSGSIQYPCVAQNKDGRLEVFTNASDGALWHIWQQTPGGTWGGWHSLGMPAGASSLSSPYVIANADGRLEAFTLVFPISSSSFSPGISGANAVWHTWQVTPGGEWGS